MYNNSDAGGVERLLMQNSGKTYTKHYVSGLYLYLMT